MKSKVYFYPLHHNSNLTQRKAALKIILAASDLASIFLPKDKVAVKTHVGDENNDTHIAAELIALGIEKLKNLQAIPFLTETSTLYSGPRSNAVTHLELAYKHGFDMEQMGCPFIMADGLLGNAEIEVPVKGILFDKVNIARDVILSDALMVFSHPTGHMVSGIGACIKNLGMGLSSRKGKMHQHSSVKPFIKKDQCVLCKSCIRWCPVASITEINKTAQIIEEKCIGCGECLTVCKYNAVKYNWGVGSKDLQQMMAEYALGALINKKNKSLFINVLADMTKDCDCLVKKQIPIIPDLGILASVDPVAIDQATLDITATGSQNDLGHISYPQLDPSIQLIHAEKIGLGSRDYQLIDLSK